MAATCAFQKQLLQGFQGDVQVRGMGPSLLTFHAQQVPPVSWSLEAQVTAFIYRGGSAGVGWCVGGLAGDPDKFPAEQKQLGNNYFLQSPRLRVGVSKELLLIRPLKAPPGLPKQGLARGSNSNSNSAYWGSGPGGGSPWERPSDIICGRRGDVTKVP